MDRKYPTPAPLFHLETNSAEEKPRYARSIKNPPLYGLCTRDFDRDHRPRRWPSGTEYQYAYCSNYRTLLPLLDGEEPHTPSRPTGAEIKECRQKENPLYQLYDPSPLPIVDKHYRGAVYRPDDPLGVQVPEELTKQKQTVHGPVRLSARTDMENVYTPSYRYKDWVDRPMPKIKAEMEANNLFCKLPQAPTQFYNFYNVVRMKRPPKVSESDPAFVSCRVIPIPVDKDLPDLPGDNSRPLMGRHSRDKITEIPYKPGEYSIHLASIC